MKITPELVVEAYKNTNIRPIWASFVENEGTCGCALTALYANKVDSKNSYSVARDLKNNGWLIERIAKELKLPKDFNMDAFYLGFDYPETKHEKSKPDYETYILGQETRKLVEKEIGPVACWNEVIRAW